MKRSLLVPLLVFMAAGCGVEFSAPQLDTGARLTLHLELVDSLGVGQARLSGNLWPGFNQAGSVRFLVDSSLELLGRTILPFPADPDSLHGVAYADQWGLNPEIPPGELELRAPDIPGIGQEAPVLRLTPPWRAGPAYLTLAAGSGLRLDLLPRPVDSTVYESWTLDLRKGDGQLASQMGANGGTPDGIEVPWPLLAPLGGGGTARLVVRQWEEDPGVRYSAALLVITQHVWSLTVQP